MRRSRRAAAGVLDERRGTVMMAAAVTEADMGLVSTGRIARRRGVAGAVLAAALLGSGAAWAGMHVGAFHSAHPHRHHHHRGEAAPDAPPPEAAPTPSALAPAPSPAPASAPRA